MKRCLLLLIACFLSANFLHSQNFLWAKQFGNPSTGCSVRGYSVVQGNSGNVYSAGDYTTLADFNPGAGMYNLPTNQGIYLSKLSDAGNFIWAKSFGLNNSGNVPYDLKVDANENIYLTGTGNGSGDYDPGPGVVNLPGASSFILKLDSAGNLLWARGLNMLGLGLLVAGSVGVDGAGNVYVYGYFEDQTDFDPGPGSYILTPTAAPGLPDVFLLKLNSAGNFVWARKFGTGDSESGTDMVVDNAGNCYFSGVTWGGFGGALNLNGQMDAFVAKANSSGTLLWARGFGGGGTDVSWGVALDSTGQVWATGYFQGVADFDPGVGTTQFTSVGQYDGYLTRYSNSGTFLSAHALSGTVSEFPTNLAVAPNGELLATGYFDGSMDMDPGSGNYYITANNLAVNTFLGRYTSSGAFLSAGSLGGAGLAYGQDVHATINGVLLTGYFKNQIDMNPTPGIFNMTTYVSGLNNYNNDAFVVKLDNCISPADASNVTPQQNLSICAGNSTILNAFGLGTLTWFNTGAGGSPIGAGSSFTTPILNSTTTFWAQDSTCGPSRRTPITVVVNSSTTSSLTVNSCNSPYSLNSQTYTQSGTYTQTLTNAVGCDSILTLTLNLQTPSTSSLTATTCDSYTAPSGAVFNQSGTFMDTIPNSVGCDSVITLQLTINNSSNNLLSVVDCDSFSLNGLTYTSSGTYTQTLTNSAGCDSVITLQLTIADSSSASIVAHDCAPFTLNGQTYSTSGTYTQLLTNVLGCDSLITLHFTRDLPTASTISPTSCDSYTSPSGHLWTQSGSYLDTIPNAAGCDSVITVLLTINSVSASIVNSSPTLTAQPGGATYQWIFCDSAIIGGATSQSFTATTSGNYAVIVTQNGCTDTSSCESLILNATPAPQTLDLRIHPNPTNGVATVDWGIPLTGLIRVMNAQGQMILQHPIHQEPSSTLELNFAAGLYLIELRDEYGKHGSARLIRQ